MRTCRGSRTPRGSPTSHQCNARDAAFSQSGPRHTGQLYYWFPVILPIRTAAGASPAPSRQPVAATGSSVGVAFESAQVACKVAVAQTATMTSLKTRCSPASTTVRFHVIRDFGGHLGRNYCLGGVFSREI